MKKTALLLFALMALCLILPAQVLGASNERDCYWQLEAVSVSMSSDPDHVARVGTDFPTLSDLTLEEAANAMRGDHMLYINLSQYEDSPRAQAVYSLRDVAPIVPGGASMTLSVTGDVRAPKHSFYIYAIVFSGDEQAERMRNSGAWVVSVPFPKKAVPGETHDVLIVAREYKARARVGVTLTYRAYAGEMVMDTNGDALIYASRQSEPERIPQSVEDLLTSFSQNISVSGPLFAAEKQEDGSVLATLDPASGLSQEELIRLIRAAVRSDAIEDDAQGEDDEEAQAGAGVQGAWRVRVADSAFTDLVSTTFSLEKGSLPALNSDAAYATLYVAPGAQLSDSALSAMLSAVSGHMAGTSSGLRDAAESGQLSLEAEATPGPQARSYSELISGLGSRSGKSSKTTYDPASTDENAALTEQAPQAVILYDKDGVVAAALAPGAEATGSDLCDILEKLRTIYPLRLSRFEQVTDTSDGFILPGETQGAPLQAIPLTSGNLILVLPGNISALLNSLDAQITELSATPTPEPTATPTPEPTEEPTPSPEPTATPTPQPTEEPTPEPTEEPTPSPKPTEEPTSEPTETSTPETTEEATPTPDPAEEATPDPISGPASISSEN